MIYASGRYKLASERGRYRNVKGEKFRDVKAMTEGKGFCRRRQEKKAQDQLKKDLTNLDKIVIIESKSKPKRR